MQPTIHKNPLYLERERAHTGAAPPFSATLSVAFYNNVRAFDLMIASIARQSASGFELIIADDGSQPEAVAHVRTALDALQIPARHIRHEKNGFRKNRMLNWVLREARSEYLIFVDQDCLLHREFVHEHILHRQPRTVLCGRRMELAPWISELLSPAKVRSGFIEKNLWWIIPAGAFRHDNHGGKGVYLHDECLRRFLNRGVARIVGCNFSVYKQDLLDINGFDWRYEHPGTGEDSDIEFRLKLNGVAMKPFSNAAVQYHVFHPLTKKHLENEALFERVQAEGKAVTRHGLHEQLDLTGA